MKNWIKKIGKMLMSRQGCLVLAVVLAAFVLPHFALADDGTSGSTTNSSVTIKAIADLLALMIKFLNSLLWPMLVVLGELMDVDRIIGPGMGDRMTTIYTEVRNLVNIAFVVVLIFVALYNVLGLGGEGELAIKTILPKIVLGLVLVNFTLPLGRVALDMANVGTDIAFGLPNVVDGYDYNADLDDFEHNMCYKSYSVDSTGYKVSFYSTTDTKNTPIGTQMMCADQYTISVNSDGYETSMSEGTDGNYDSLNSLIKGSYFTNLNKNNLGLILAVNMGKLGSLNILKQGSIETFEDLTVNMLFSVVMYLVFAISFIVMGLVLIVRIVVLWLALALSPLAVLVYVVPQIKEWAGGAGDFSQKVIKHLVAPIIMGVAMSFGFLLMDAWNRASSGTNNAFENLASSNVLNAQFLISGIDDLPKLILAIGSIVVVWTGIFAAANDTFASGIANSIKSLGEEGVKALGMGAMSIPTLGVAVKEGEEGVQTSPLAAFRLAEDQVRKYSSGAFAQQGVDELAKKLGLSTYGPGAADSNQVSRQLAQDMRNVAGTIDPSAASKIVTQVWQLVEGSNMESSAKSQARDTITRNQSILEDKTGKYNDSQKTAAFREITQLVQKMDKEKVKVDNFTELQEAAKRSATANVVTPPTASAPSTPAAATTAIQGVVQMGTATGANDLSTAITAMNTVVTAAPTPAPAGAPAGTQPTPNAAAAFQTRVTNLQGLTTTANTALATLQATPTAANLTAARTAVSAAATEARAMSQDTNLMGVQALAGPVRTANTQLTQMEQQLTQINL